MESELFNFKYKRASRLLPVLHLHLLDDIVFLHNLDTFLVSVGLVHQKRPCLKQLMRQLFRFESYAQNHPTVS